MSKTRSKSTPILDQDEQALLAGFEAGEYRSVLGPGRADQLAEVADATVRKDKRINIRLSSRDLQMIQRRALEAGIPYQTLAASILHKYLSGSLQDVSANRPDLL